MNVHLNTPPVRVAILGANGLVGQTFAALLEGHPKFRVFRLFGSERRRSEPYRTSVRWTVPLPFPHSIGDLPLEPYAPERMADGSVDLVFSALPSVTAGPLEEGLAQAGFPVFSNAGAHRMGGDVPILIPDVNPHHLEWVHRQNRPGQGCIVTNANCSTTGLVSALAPLRPLGLRRIVVTTFQSVSGAGLNGVSHMDISGNLIPHIPGEEEKMQRETAKILDLQIPVLATCVRTSTLWGHLESVCLELDGPAEGERIRALWEDHRCAIKGIHGMPERPLRYLEGDDAPQPGRIWQEDPTGMQTLLGRLRVEGRFCSFLLLSNNLIKGAAGGSIANAEAFLLGGGKGA